MKRFAALAIALVVLGSCRERYDPRRDTALKDNLTQMRRAIEGYKADKGHYPQSLDDLVPNYIRKIPPDPITQSHTTWRLTTEETVQPSSDFQSTTSVAPATVIIDVHSGAPGADRNGVLYSNY